MKLHIKYDINLCCKTVLQEQLERLDLPYTVTGFGEVETVGEILPDKYRELQNALSRYGIEIIDDPKNVFTQKIKDAIIEMVYLDDQLPSTTTSIYLSEKFNKSYNYIAAIFSEVTFTSIQSFIMLQKIERSKQEIVEGKETLTEIAFKLNFSSVGHLSNEFKKVTGLTPTAFQRIIKKRNQTQNINEH